MKSTSNPHKKSANFRLSHQTLVILTMLEEKLHTSKTAVVEKALQYYANQKLKSNNGLMQFAGILSSAESNNMLLTIKNDRRNKKIKARL